MQKIYIYIYSLNFFHSVTSIKHRKLQLGGRVEDCLHRAIIHSCVSSRNSTKRPPCPPALHSTQRKTFIASVVSTHAKTAQWNRKHRANNFAWALLKVHKTPYLFPLVPPLSSYFHPFVLSLRNFFFPFFFVTIPLLCFLDFTIYIEIYHKWQMKEYFVAKKIYKNTCLISSWWSMSED